MGAGADTLPAARPRLAGLDGIRGLAALFVVLNHVFLRAFPGYPRDTAPPWAAGFIYGRFAVVVFIVLSGFSLGLAPARGGWRLGSLTEYARRRAWRILPPYWVALLFSLIMTWDVVAQPGWPEPTPRSALVHGLLLQDVVATPSPNRAFWTIAIEAQLYVALPLLILVARRFSGASAVAAVALPVLALGLLAAAGSGRAAELVAQYTPDLAVLFALGLAAAGVVAAPAGGRSRAWPWYALALAAPVAALVIGRGSVWTIGHFFWVDLALGPAVAALLVAVVGGRPRLLVRLLDTGPLRRLGSFSYSLYLTHAPIVIALYYGWLRGRVSPGVPTFVVLTAVVLPVSMTFAWLFATVFELPFQRRRSLRTTTRPAELIAVEQDRAFAGWLEQRLRADVVLAPGYEHPAEPGHPDSTHRH